MGGATEAAGEFDRLARLARDGCTTGNQDITQNSDTGLLVGQL